MVACMRQMLPNSDARRGRRNVGSVQVDVPTAAGPARLHVAAAQNPRALLWLGHGAGGGVNALDLSALAAALPGRGITVVRHEQPWRVAGGRVAPRPATLDAAWRESAAAVLGLAAGAPLLVGGRSAGARVACRTAADVGAVGVVCLAFPLHPPSRPEKSRLEELLQPTVPVLVVQGERDTFGTAQDVEREARDRPRIRVVAMPGADHSMKVLTASPVPQREVSALVSAAVGDFLDEVLG
jgi:predicted alpha/beta-hydrolase family hydrolase